MGRRIRGSKRADGQQPSARNAGRPCVRYSSRRRRTVRRGRNRGASRENFSARLDRRRSHCNRENPRGISPARSRGAGSDVIVADLSTSALRHRLADGGIRLRTGPVVSSIRTRSEKIIEGLASHYADYPCEDENGFADFHVGILPPRGARRWLKPQIAFQFDGATPFFPLPADQAFAMLEWGLNWCVSFHCHQYLIVHAAAVEKSGLALLLPGSPGAGKSTLCAGLVSRGWRLLSDELTLLELGTGCVVPLPRPISLKNQSIEVIRCFAPEAVFTAPVHDTAKGSVAHMRAPVESVRRASDEARPRWIVLPKFRSGS